jgi:outer membrane immunogenic protein
VPPPVANWAGFYLGGNVGGGTARDRSSYTFPTLGGPAGMTELFNLSPDGINGGIQAGYNWQASNWVFGLEADIQGSSQRDNRACVLLCIGTGPGLALVTYDARLPWFGTARGRIGYSVGSTLFYATGGYAYGSVTTKATVNIQTLVGNVEFSNTRGGWTAGAGVETPFTLLGLFGPNWSSKTEYLYVDLGTSAGTTAFPIPGFGLTLPFSSSSQVHEHIFRTGLNYHFNAPVVAKY